MSVAVRFGNYMLLERINVGGMAEVFKAKAFGIEGFERLLAVKRILPNIAEDNEFVTMFIDEAKIAVQLNHPNIAQIFDLGKVGDAYFIAMEYVDGKDLRVILDRARQQQPVPQAIACFIVCKLCEGLDYAHNKVNAQGEQLNLVHRDVSPQNVILSYDGEVKIVDFGIAKAVGKVSKTQSGILKGKFGYMSPEQVRGLPLDQRSDVFTVGICLYELLSNRRLFLGHSDFSTLEKVRNVEILPLSSHADTIDEELESITLKALAKNVEDRYASAAALRQDLQSYMQKRGLSCSAKDLSDFMQSSFRAEAPAVEHTRGSAGRRATPTLPPQQLSSPPPPPPPQSPRHALLRTRAPAPRLQANRTQAGSPQAARREAAMAGLVEEMTTRVYDRPHANRASPSWDPLLDTWSLKPATPRPPQARAADPGEARDARRMWGFSPPNAGPPRVDGFFSPAPRQTQASQAGRASGLPPASARIEKSLAGDSSERRGRRQVSAATLSMTEPTLITDLRSAASKPRTASPAWRWWMLAPLGATLLALLAWWMIPPAAPATLQIITEPSDARVTFDDRPLLATSSPFLIADVEPLRSHTLSVSKPGYRSWSMQVDLQPGQTLVLPTVRLAPQPHAGGLLPSAERRNLPEAAAPASASGFMLDSNPSGATLWINERATMLRTPVRVDDLQPGVYKIRLEADEHHLPWNSELNLSPGQILNLPPVQLQLRNVTLQVNSEPPGALVELVRGDLRRHLGTTPVSTEFKANEEGWSVQVTHRGYAAWQQPLQATPGQPAQQLLAVLQPLRSAARRPRGDRLRNLTPIESQSNAAPPLLETPPVGSEAEEANPPSNAEPSPNAAPSGEVGILRVNSRPWAQVVVDGQTVGNTPQSNLSLPAGEHTVELLNPEFGLRKTLKVQIVAGQTLTKVVDLSTQD